MFYGAISNLHSYRCTNKNVNVTQVQRDESQRNQQWLINKLISTSAMSHQWLSFYVEISLVQALRPLIKTI